MISDAVKATLLGFQRSEMTEHHTYRRLAALQRSAENRALLEQIADDELRHARCWQQYTRQEVTPDWGKVRRVVWTCRLLGLTFGTKLMERVEDRVQRSYQSLPPEVVETETVRQDEKVHEQALLSLIDEERLRYMGSIVLGLNDALIELTGVLAGLTLALRNTRLIAMTGCITGIAAAFSMAASEYLSTKADGPNGHPLKSAVYTGVAYILTVILLILPYLLLPSYYVALGATLMVAIAIIALFNYYISVAKDQPFARRFGEMAGLSLGVAGLSFLMGFLLRGMGIGDA